jgi:hypothetical protein
MENEKEQTVEVTALDPALVPPGSESPEVDAIELDEEIREADYHEFGKKEFVKLLNDLTKAVDWKQTDRVLREVKPLFDELRHKDREEAFQKFLASGSKKEDFEYRVPDLDSSFDAAYKLLRDRITQHQRSLEEQKHENLRLKEELLEKLRALVDSEDSEHSFTAFKEIQKTWKSIGSVAPSQTKTLWANYMALVDRFYDQRSIYFELKDLDRKKNLEAKVELCVRAEKLAEQSSINDAVRELNDLHNEFKHVGPVPLEEKDQLWNRFKAASDQVYTKRDAYVQELQRSFAVNAEAKASLLNELLPYASFQTDRIKEWNQKTLEVLEFQKKWSAIGVVSRAKARELNKQFWHAFKTFFHNKRAFFKKLDQEREQNLQLKKDLVAAAKQLQESSDWNATSNTLKELQRKWKEVGPVPEKFRESIFVEFKTACDHFFDQRRNVHDQEAQAQQENLVQKEAICQQLEEAVKAGDLQMDKLNALQEQFHQLGFVPRDAMGPLRDRYQKAVDAYVAQLPVDNSEKTKMMLQSQMANLRHDPQGDKKIYQKEQTLRKRLQKAENDLATLKNNLEFFGRSKNADKLREEFNGKIQEATEEVKQLKDQLKLLKSLG